MAWCRFAKCNIQFIRVIIFFLCCVFAVLRNKSWSSIYGDCFICFSVHTTKEILHWVTLWFSYCVSSFFCYSEISTVSFRGGIVVVVVIVGVVYVTYFIQFALISSQHKSSRSRYFLLTLFSLSFWLTNSSHVHKHAPFIVFISYKRKTVKLLAFELPRCSRAHSLHFFVFLPCIFFCVSNFECFFYVVVKRTLRRLKTYGTSKS